MSNLTNRYPVIITMRMSTELGAQLKQMAHDDWRSVSGLLRYLIDKETKQRNIIKQAE